MINHFASLKMLALMTFYKFYLSGKKPNDSDIPDIIMSSSYPYVDKIITENNQAELMRQVQKRHKFLPNLEIETIADLL